MRSKTKDLLFILISVLMLSSCASIEKRRYMNGYHIEWLSKNKTKPDSLEDKSKNVVHVVDSMSIENPSTLMAVNSSEKNIVITIPKARFVHVTFTNDSLARKNEKHLHKKHNYKRESTIGLTSILLSFVSYLIGFAIFYQFPLIFYLFPPLFIFGLIMLLRSLRHRNQYMKDNPEKSKFRAVVIFGMICVWIILVIFIFFVIISIPSFFFI